MRDDKMRICGNVSRSVSGDLGAATTAKRLTDRTAASAPRGGATGLRAMPRNSVLSNQHSVLGTPSSNPAIQRICGIKPWLLPALSAAVVLGMLAGCSPYGPEKIRTAPKSAAKRTAQQVFNDCNNAFNELETTIRNVRDTKTATEAASKVAETYVREAALYIEAMAVAKSADKGQEFEEHYKDNLKDDEASLAKTIAEMKKKVPELPPEFLKAMEDGKAAMDKAEEDVKAQAAAPLPEILPEDPPPPTFGYATLLLCLFVLAACVAFLFQEGIWGNAVRLVNVVFAVLLALNFYEPVAAKITNISADVKNYVVMFDFISLWVCFAVCMAVFRTVTDQVSKVKVRFLQVVDRPGGIVLSICIGWVMVGFTLISLHVSPLSQYPMLGSFKPQDGMFLGLAPDRELLGFAKYQSSGAYSRSADHDTSFPNDFIETQLMRRMHLEHYVLKHESPLINPQFVGSTKPPPK
jgi:hypothetical protein